MTKSVSPEVGGDAEDDNQHGVVDVESVGDEGENAHGSHDLKQRGGGERLRDAPASWRCALIYRGVRRLLLVLVRDGRVHVDQTQEVQTQRRSQAAEEPAGERSG